MNVRAGFSGWWCSRCERECPTIPEDLDAAQAKCPHCRHWTARYVPPGAGVDRAELRLECTGRERAGELRRLMAGAAWVRKQPTAARSKELFAHLRQVIENPALEPDLNKLEEQKHCE